MLFIDRADVSRKRVTSDGYMVADARVARVGIQHYAGYEVGKPELQSVAVYRPEEEVFKSDSLSTYAHRPVTIGHPPEGVSAKNWRDVARGAVGGDVMRDGEFVRVPMTIMDQAAIRDVEGGVCEISMGYHCRLEFVDGVSPQGDPYQAVQRDLRMNHAAIVPKGRAGSQCRIGDSWTAFETAGPRDPDGTTQRNLHHNRETVSMKTLTIDGHPVELSDAAVIAVSNLQKQLSTAVADAAAKADALTKATSDHKAAIDAKDTAHAGVLKAKDTELATKDAEIEKLKAAAIDDAKLDALVTARADVIGKARGIVADVKTEGVSIPEIRRSVVSAKFGDAAVKDKSDDYVEARFDLLADEAKKAGGDPVRRAIATGGTTQTADSDPHARRTQALRDAWKQPPARATAA